VFLNQTYYLGERETHGAAPRKELSKEGPAKSERFRPTWKVYHRMRDATADPCVQSPEDRKHDHREHAENAVCSYMPDAPTRARWFRRTVYSIQAPAGNTSPMKGIRAQRKISP
jgi:hypothetical protein